MALIKCPECGKEVSTSADACPHCGYPIGKQNNNGQKIVIEQAEEDKSSWPKPKDQAWINKWKDKAKKTKLTWAFILLACIVGVIISACLLANDKDVVHYSWGDSYYTKTVHIVFTGIFGFLTFDALVLWLTLLICCHVRARQYDGYAVLVYNGFKHYLVIEDVIHDSGVVNRYLYGALPNKKQVWVTISAWDGSVKMGIGNGGDEKNLL